MFFGNPFYDPFGTASSTMMPNFYRTARNPNYRYSEPRGGRMRMEDVDDDRRLGGYRVPIRFVDSGDKWYEEEDEEGPVALSHEKEEEETQKEEGDNEEVEEEQEEKDAEEDEEDDEEEEERTFPPAGLTRVSQQPPIQSSTSRVSQSQPSGVRTLVEPPPALISSHNTVKHKQLPVAHQILQPMSVQQPLQAQRQLQQQQQQLQQRQQQLQQRQQQLLQQQQQQQQQVQQRPQQRQLPQQVQQQLSQQQQQQQPRQNIPSPIASPSVQAKTEQHPSSQLQPQKPTSTSTSASTSTSSPPAATRTFSRTKSTPNDLRNSSSTIPPPTDPETSKKLQELENILQTVRNIGMKYSNLAQFLSIDLKKIPDSKLELVHKKVRTETIKFEEELIAQMLKLDAFETGGLMELRKKRKDIVETIQKMLKPVDLIKKEVIVKLEEMMRGR